MNRRIVLICPLLLQVFATADLGSENYIVNGSQESEIAYSLTQRIVPAGTAASVQLSFVAPETYSTPTYSQTIRDLRFTVDPLPQERKERRDERGNRIIDMSWRNLSGPLTAGISCTAETRTILKPLESKAGFPPTSLPDDVDAYLKPSVQVQSDHPDIRRTSSELTAGVTTEFDAVRRIVSWVIDHMKYVTPPEEYDALYSFRTGLGNCQNYSHLAAALARAAGIPVRIVNGVTLKEPFTMKTGQGEFTFRMGQGRHSWIEVYYPDLGWIPYDPQQTELFVSNRFIRIEVGVDNKETEKDGVVRYRQAPGAGGRPEFQETIEAAFPSDRIHLTSVKQDYGPRSILLAPEVTAEFKPVVTHEEPPPKTIPGDVLDKLQFSERYIFGNLNFPRNVDFLTTREVKSGDASGELVFEKNFLVETAEYVTKKMLQYAQIIIVDKPLKLYEAALALHKFGGGGQVWVELMADDGGRPGGRIAVSDMKDLRDIPRNAGYDWVGFRFTASPPILSPGRYWIALGFTGSPIINWFYSYGKPVGPMEGTRYKSPYDDEWSGALAYEFNYRIAGLTSK
ncbi:transglutaminase domain-containing protein [bacterium]|nr:transglutaminase domain-containing protein [bacterium]